MGKLEISPLLRARARFFYCATLILMSAAACTGPRAASRNPGTTEEKTVSTIDLLRASSYEELFETLDQSKLKAVLGSPNAKTNLKQYALDTNAPATSRFLAAEVLATDDAGFPTPTEAAQLAVAYANELQITPTGNRWGLPWKWGGPASDHFLRLGSGVVVQLKPLLSDARIVRYNGSREATEGNYYQIRVKDIAAYLITRILGESHDIEVDQAARDRFIQALARRIG